MLPQPWHLAWEGRVQLLSLARGAPTCAQELAQGHRRDLAGQSPVEGLHCLLTAQLQLRGLLCRSPGKCIVLNAPEMGLLPPG